MMWWVTPILLAIFVWTMIQSVRTTNRIVEAHKAIQESHRRTGEILDRMNARMIERLAEGEETP